MGKKISDQFFYFKSSGWMPEINNAFKNMKPDFFANSPIKAAYDAVAPDKTKWAKFLEQMFVFAAAPFNIGDSNIAKITSPVLLITGDNNGLDKIELMKTYQMLAVVYLLIWRRCQSRIWPLFLRSGMSA